MDIVTITWTNISLIKQMDMHGCKGLFPAPVNKNYKLENSHDYWYLHDLVSDFFGSNIYDIILKLLQSIIASFIRVHTYTCKSVHVLPA